MALTRAPWAEVDPALADLLRPALPAVVAQLVAAIPAAIPAYGPPRDDQFRHGLERGVEIALSRMLDLLGRDEPALGQAQAVYERLGAGEYRAGRPLESLQAAYRLGARITWRALADLVARAAETEDGPLLPRRQVVSLAEALFAYIDELAGASAAGYAREQSLQAGHLDALRTRLLELVLAGAAPDEQLTTLAHRVRWTLPPRLRVAVLTDGGDEADRLRRPVLGPDVLLGEVADGAVALLPADPPDRVRSRLAGVSAAVGTAQPAPAAATSWAHAQAVAALEGRRRPGPVLADDHLAALLLHADQALLHALHRRALAPLDAVRPDRRRLLAQTLLAWLDHQGGRPAVAAQLRVHPQTVSYRLAQLRELLGAALDDPDARFDLLIALRADQRCTGRPTSAADSGPSASTT